MYSRCCKVYRSGRLFISSSESWKEFQLPTAPKMVMVARMGMLRGRMIFSHTFTVEAPSITALSSREEGMDSM